MVVNTSDTTEHTARTVEISRSSLQKSRRAAQQRPPLLRGRLSESMDEETIEVPVPTTSTVERETIHVLHVDDDPEFSEVTRAFFERIDESFALVDVTSVVEALDRLQNREFDCIISDYDMPNTNGIEFLELVREQYPDLPFILLTGKGSEEIASEAIAAGVTDYMQKGSGTEQYEMLANRVRNAVDRYWTRRQFWQALSWYQRLVEQDLTGVFIVQDGEFVYVNERLADIFGYDQSRLIGESPLVLANDTADEITLDHVLELHDGHDDTFQFEFTGRRSDGTEMPVEVHGGRIQYQNAPGCIGILWARD